MIFIVTVLILVSPVFAVGSMLAAAKASLELEAARSTQG